MSDLSQQRVAGITSAEFDHLVRNVGPFEARPHVAVAVSGGSDSMALALLMAGWAARRDGEITAITVDHGLRAEAAAEARQVGRWLRARGMRHRILHWEPRPGVMRGGVQAAARAARYDLLADWCRRHGALHLALAHQQDDQAETLLLRLARGSGLDGLAGMAPITERAGLRLIRPMLAIPRVRLQATLTEAHQPWINDPSNDDPAHARIRMRRLLPLLGAEGLEPARLAAAAAHLGRARAAIDDAVAALLAEAAAIYPAGYARLDAAMLRSAPAEVSLRAFAHCLMAVAGGEYAPRLDRLERLHGKVRSGALGGGATLGGCMVVPRGSTLIICREPDLAVEEKPIVTGRPVVWDARFRISLALDGGARGSAGLVVRRLGAEGWATVAARNPPLRRHPIPAIVRPSLPALWHRRDLVAVPHLDVAPRHRHITVAALFHPRVPFAGTRFRVA